MKTRASILIAATTLLLGFEVLSQPGSAEATAGSISGSGGRIIAGQTDDRRDTLTGKQRALLKQAKNAVLNGKAKGYGRTGQVARGQFVELERRGEDAILTVLGEFSDYPHNSIPEPDRAIDNTTIWRKDFNRDYYLDMLFAEGPGANSMRGYYIEQSSNRYAVYGDVSEWVGVPGGACDYDDGYPGPGSAVNVWQFLIDSLQAWYDGEIAGGKSPEKVDSYLSQFDVWDRFDWDGDGNFDEPDGYIDHMQFVHSGEGNEFAGNTMGDCAIWSHSGYAYESLLGVAGPSPEYLLGGVQIGSSSYWVNKYIIVPENGGMGVSAHEFGHDLNLPDLYDTTGIPGLLENSTGYWSLMSAGSWLSDGTVDIGSKPGHMSVWEKFQLGWLNYQVAYAGQKSEHKLGPAETNTRQAQGLFVVLPDKTITEEIAEPYSGSYFYYSGSGNTLDNHMYKSFSLPPNSSLTAMVNFEIEPDYDYAYLVISTDDGFTWQNVETSSSTTDDPNGLNSGYGITGSSGGWVALSADLAPYTGNALIGLRYSTDGAVAGTGFMVDDILITGSPLDDAESDTGWSFGGFRLTTGTESGLYFNAYVAEFRQYRGYDESLASAYSYGWYGDPLLGKYVEHFPYLPGLLISYWDTSFQNNDVYSNCLSGRCGGFLLPIDAHPQAMFFGGGGLWPNRIQAYDATFGLSPTEALTLHWDGLEFYQPGLPAEPVFDDNTLYWDPLNWMGSVLHPHTGTRIRVKSVSALGSFMQVEVKPSE